MWSSPWEGVERTPDWAGQGEASRPQYRSDKVSASLLGARSKDCPLEES